MSIENKVFDENEKQNDELIDEIAGEIDNIDTLTSYICADFERFIENNGIIRADSLQGTQQLVFIIENQLISIARKLAIIERRKLA
ncbi:hypothetical protein IJ541_05185 [bacterium]|nr:hypothetical protein [bacterium]